MIVYLSAFSLAIRMMLSRKKKAPRPCGGDCAPAADAAPPEEPAEEPTDGRAGNGPDGGRRRPGMTFLIQQTLIYAVPLMIVALAGVFAERSGIINLAWKVS